MINQLRALCAFVDLRTLINENLQLCQKLFIIISCFAIRIHKPIKKNNGFSSKYIKLSIITKLKCVIIIFQRINYSIFDLRDVIILITITSIQFEKNNVIE